MVVEVAYSWFFKQSQKRLFVQAVLGKSVRMAQADMLIFDTLLVDVSRFPLSRFTISFAAYEHGTESSPLSAFSPRARPCCIAFALPCVDAAERGMQERHCNTGASRPSRELAVPLCWTRSVLLPDCAEIVPTRCSPQLQRLPCRPDPCITPRALASLCLLSFSPY